MRFFLTADAIEDWVKQHPMAEDRAGAFVTFDGRVRNHHEGKAVTSLEYEVFEPLAQSEGEQVIREALERFDIIDARAIHRHGHLQIGEAAVWVGVLAAQRKEAFAAARYIIDEIKHRLPIWKKEHYASGDAIWVNCQGCIEAHAHTAYKEADLYVRQTMLPDVGEAGQQKLKQARVLVIGAGGLGCPVLQYLTAAGVGTIGICEFDAVSADNLHRQLLYGVNDIGQPKAEIAVEKLSAQNPFVQFHTHGKLSAENAVKLFSQYDLVLDCTDNFSAKFLINDAAVLSETPALHASLYQYEGQLHGYLPKQTACLRCLWPETPDTSGVGNCADSGIIGAVAGSIGSMQAMEAIKFILGLPNIIRSGEWLTINLLDFQTLKIARDKNPRCPACGESARLSLSPSVSIDIDTLNTWENYLVVDVRSDIEKLTPAPQGVQPVAQFMDKNGHYTLETKEPVILVCQRGRRSLALATHLRDTGITNVYSLSGGIQALEEWKQSSMQTAPV